MVIEDGIPRHACWLAQQAAEKAIKAILVLLQIDFPRSHDLDRLRALLPNDCDTYSLDLDNSGLTEWAVQARYPGDWPEASKKDAFDAVQIAVRIVEAVGGDLLAYEVSNEEP